MTVILTTKSLSNADGARQPLSNRIFSIARTKSLSSSSVQGIGNTLLTRLGTAAKLKKAWVDSSSRPEKASASAVLQFANHFSRPVLHDFSTIL